MYLLFRRCTVKHNVIRTLYTHTRSLLVIEYLHCRVEVVFVTDRLLSMLLSPLQVTEDTANLLRSTFKVVERGLVPVKGKGVLKTYFLGEELRGGIRI